MTIRRPLALAGAAICLIAGGCSGDDSSSSTSDAPSTSTSASSTSATTDDSTAPDECRWLSVEAASAAIGADMAVAAAGDAGCLFNPPAGDGPGIQISVIQIAIDVDDYLAGSKEVCDGTIVVVDNGDDAWACDSGINPQGVVAFGSELVVADITDTDSPATGVPLAAAVAAALHAG